MAEEQIEDGITATGRNESGTLLPQRVKNSGVNNGQITIKKDKFIIGNKFGTASWSKASWVKFRASEDFVRPSLIRRRNSPSTTTRNFLASPGVPLGIWMPFSRPPRPLADVWLKKLEPPSVPNAERILNKKPMYSYTDENPKLFVSCSKLFT